MPFSSPSLPKSEARISKSEASSKLERNNDRNKSVCADVRVFVIGILIFEFISNLGFHFGFTFSVSPCTAAISTASPFSMGILLTAFQYSPSMKILPPRESIGVNVVTVFPTIVSAPAFTGKRLARRRSEEHTSELQSQFHLVCRLLLEKKNTLIKKKLEGKL